MQSVDFDQFFFQNSVAVFSHNFGFRKNEKSRKVFQNAHDTVTKQLHGILLSKKVLNESEKFLKIIKRVRQERAQFGT